MNVEVPSDPRRQARKNVFLPVGTVLFALVVSQGYFAGELLRNSSRLRQAEAGAQEIQAKMAPAVEALRQKQPEIEADQQMAIDLTRTLMKLAEGGNDTARTLLPAIRHDLQQLQLKIHLADDDAADAGDVEER